MKDNMIDSPVPNSSVSPSAKAAHFSKLADYETLWGELIQKGYIQDLLNSFNQILKTDKVINYQSASQRLEKSEFALKDSGESLQVTMADLQDYIKEAVNTQSPYFLNQLYGGMHPVAIMAELVAAFMNTSMATYEIAPVASIMEAEILKAINTKINWAAIDGLFVPGGSYANMMAMHVARFKLNPETKLKGHDPRLKIYISDQAHYSVKKAAHLLGFGEEAVRIIASDDKQKLNSKELKKQIQKDIEDKQIPAMVVSTLGTTVFGAIDPIAEVQAVCDEYQIWHHVDAAWGGPLIFTSESVCEQLNMVDSVAFDFHKLLAAGLTKAIFVTRHQDLMIKSNSCAGTEYIFHEDEDSFFDTGVKAIQCGRKVDSLTLWTLWKYLGHEGMALHVSKLLDLRKNVLSEIQKRGYTLLHQPEYLNICFKLPDSSHPKQPGSDELQKQIRQYLIKEGSLYINYSSNTKDGVFFRLVLSHLRLDQNTVAEVFNILGAAWERVAKGQ